ncbi:MAG: hypothetical protein IIZ13_00105 [Renibacterium sp.]|nr:hypothetical protein [Renibacterium sp.]
MTSIEDLMSAADPMRNRAEPIPDAEAELRQIVSGMQMFSDRVPPGLVDLDRRRKLRRNRLIGVVAAAAAAALIVLGIVTNFGQQRMIPLPMPANTGTHSATVPVKPAVEWRSFTDATGQASFEYRSDWSITEQPGEAYGLSLNTVRIKDAAGLLLATLALSSETGVGGSCQAPKPLSVLDSVPLGLPQKAAKLAEDPRGPSSFVYRIMESDKVYGSMALADPELQPKTASCLEKNGILGPDNFPFVNFEDRSFLNADGMDAALVFNTVAEARAYMETQRYQDIKRMLVSLALRPVG